VEQNCVVITVPEEIQLKRVPTPYADVRNACRRSWATRSARSKNNRPLWLHPVSV
jgi:hypothetical protein